MSKYRYFVINNDRDKKESPIPLATVCRNNLIEKQRAFDRFENVYDFRADSEQRYEAIG